MVDNKIKEFGRSHWETLHTIAVNCKTNKDAEIFKLFLFSHSYLFPGEKCKPYYKRALKSVNIDNFNCENGNIGEALFYYTYLLHDSVNKRLGKKSISFDEGLRKYTFKSCHCKK